jgi:hypothetical protein
LLVHSPLVGHATWNLVAAGLAERGYPVGVPDLSGTVAAGPPYCSRQAEVIAAHPQRPRSSSAIAGRDRCWPPRAPSSNRSAVTSSSTPACRHLGRTGWKPFRRIWPSSCGRWLMPRAGCHRGRNGGAMRSWPSSSRTHECGGISRPAAPAAAGHVRGSSPASAAVARCPRRLPAAERGIRGSGSQGAGTRLASDATGEPPPRAADRPGLGHRIAARAARSASPQAVAPPGANAMSAVAATSL